MHDKSLSVGAWVCLLTCGTPGLCWWLESGCPWSQLLCRIRSCWSVQEIVFSGASIAPSLRIHWDCPGRTILSSRLQMKTRERLRWEFTSDSLLAALLVYLSHRKADGSWNGHDSLCISLTCTGLCFCRQIQSLGCFWKRRKEFN